VIVSVVTGTVVVVVVGTDDVVVGVLEVVVGVLVVDESVVVAVVESVVVAGALELESSTVAAAVAVASELLDVSSASAGAANTSRPAMAASVAMDRFTMVSPGVVCPSEMAIRFPRTLPAHPRAPEGKWIPVPHLAIAPRRRVVAATSQSEVSHSHARVYRAREVELGEVPERGTDRLPSEWTGRVARACDERLEQQDAARSRERQDAEARRGPFGTRT
jgi:hypothetical protein